ncbi:hypothetical protein Pedsa_0597 [Pseudopedobacter saltans DSM 12145]|uniref:HEAT repeat domain-containing protein n=1 Tax=Pseudopedobacter saltans (strain ATCC 51119 / DSM 12145 / JCM 21818 / CCUG 39354 / LMG 10337 / NBRC 100064 / NCIMB 13643) TaxID=762903 RepID=F0S7F0_PSESL|nr:hypothetical protein [Pseudopedobacter saltans]ADY51175.1 hypothetical protein Pedsa_0597 [Pseudopedobacter saltans DSM 12145]
MPTRVTIQELVIAIIVVLILVLLLTIIVLTYSFYRYRVLHNRESWKKIIEYKISEVIVDGQETIHNDKDFLGHLKDSSFRNLFLAVLVASNRKFSGAAQSELKKLFYGFQLDKDAWKKLRRKESYLVAIGIQELASMGVESAIPQITSLLESPRQQIYQEAQYAIVSFKGFEGLDFLNDLLYPLSDWQQLRLLSSLKEIPENSSKSISNWLGNQNESVVIFTLRLIKKFQLLSFYSQVWNMLDRATINTQIHIVRTLRVLENANTIQQLISVFSEKTEQVQLEILKALKIAKNKKSGPFLQQQLWEHPTVSIKIAAAEALIALEQQQYLQQIANENTTPEQLIQIIKHALQEKIC